MQQGMERPLRAAARAVETRQTPEQALWRTVFSRVVRVVIDKDKEKGNRNGYRSHSDCHLFYLHIGQKIADISITGMKPSAIAAMMSHAATSDAFFEPARLPLA